MTVGTSLRAVARNLITNVFGNSVSVYSFSSATKTVDDEGHETISDWKTATSGKAVMNELLPNIVTIAPQFEETIGSADIVVRDDLTILLKDRVDINSVRYQVDEIDQTARSNDVLILQTVKLHKMEIQS